MMDKGIITQNNYLKRKYVIERIYVLHNYVLSSTMAQTFL